jgi:hypothetical protein
MSEFNIQLTTVILKFPMQVGLFIIAVSFLVSLIRDSIELDSKEFLICLIKFIAYGGLALFIYAGIALKKNTDVMTYFTYLLACLEAGHNFANSLGVIVAEFIKPMKYFLKNINSSIVK